MRTIRAVITKELRLCKVARCLWENLEGGLQGSDIQGLSADLIEAARRRNLSANSFAEMNAPGHGFLPGRRPRVSIPGVFLSGGLGGLSVPGRGEERREPQADRAALSFAYKHRDLKIRSPDPAPAPQGAHIVPVPLRYPPAARLFQNQAAGRRLRPRVPLGQCPFPNRLPVRGIDPAHLGRSPEGGG